MVGELVLAGSAVALRGRMSTREIRQQVALALAAVKDKKAEDIALLELPKESSAFTDYFLICSGSNPRQVQAIADAVDEALSRNGVEPNNREGFDTAEWILLDYVDFVVHIFSSARRGYYDLERLWKSAKHLTEEELLKPKAAVKAPAKVAAKKSTAKKAVGKKQLPPKKTAKKSAKKAVKKPAAKKVAKKAKRRK
jgi:ribosome-associated protein